MLEGETTYATIGCAMRSTYVPLLICLFTIYIGYTSFFDLTPFLIFDTVTQDNFFLNKNFIFYVVRIGIALNLLIALCTRISTCSEGYFLWKKSNIKNLDRNLFDSVSFVR